MRIGVPRESLAGEKRVAASPKSVQALIKMGFEVVIESQAGQHANFLDSAYEAAGASIADSSTTWQADLIFRVNAPQVTELDNMKSGASIVSFVAPAQNPDLLEKAKAAGVNMLAMDAVPRISRAQALDALSSMANIAGYRAVVEASHEFGRFFGGQITAAGKIPPAKIMIIGAGVAGLAAIGAAGSLGAIVRAFDTRPEVKEQIESMGGTFLELDFEEETDSSDGYAKEMSAAFIEAEMALFMEQAKDVDIIITTAMIPGKPAPKLITAEMVKAMKPGGIIVDLAAGGGGNCELTEPGKKVVKHEITIIGYDDLPSRLPEQSSTLYSTNLVNMMKLLCPEKDGTITLDFEDEVIRGMT
ncbi:MAG: Re/Si-specific NAD(P)(+) transhydrogenase subunit alpha, partial [Gammaproteobacteria bacterium]|nr:Re/Si-specific NAD(P)(+) transhydrogenase subunit alpha [Gammaproteobacteria bacterium]